jgi:hypothetical protein
MSTENETGVLTFPSGQGPHSICAARVERGAPDAYRLARYRTSEGAVHLKLQGYFWWWQGSEGGGEWRDIPTVDLTEIQP